MNRQHRSISPDDETDDEVVDQLIELIEWLNRWGPTLRDIDAHPEKYPLPVLPRQGRPLKKSAPSITPA